MLDILMVDALLRSSGWARSMHEPCLAVCPAQTLVLGPPGASETVTVPPANVTYSTNFTQPSETFTDGSWQIDLPAPLTSTEGQTLAFATGVEFVLNITAGGAVPATYTATFEATVQFMQVQWQFAVTSYPPNTLPVDYNALNVTITGPSAGTPQVSPSGAQGATSVAAPPQTAQPVCLYAPPPPGAVVAPPPPPAFVLPPPPPPLTVPGMSRNLPCFCPLDQVSAHKMANDACVESALSPRCNVR